MRSQLLIKDLQKIVAAAGSLPAAAYAARWVLAPRRTDQQGNKPTKTDQQGNKPTTVPNALRSWDTTFHSIADLVFSFFNLFFSLLISYEVWFKFNLLLFIIIKNKSCIIVWKNILVIFDILFFYILGHHFAFRSGPRIAGDGLCFSSLEITN